MRDPCVGGRLTRPRNRVLVHGPTRNTAVIKHFPHLPQKPSLLFAHLPEPLRFPRWRALQGLLRATVVSLVTVFAVGKTMAAGTEKFYGLSFSYNENASNADFTMNEAGVKTVRIFASWDWSDRSGVENHGEDVFTKARVLKKAGYDVIMLFDNPHSASTDKTGKPGSACTYANVYSFFKWAKNYRGVSGNEVPMKEVIDYWEILNELNLPQYWSGNASTYVSKVLKGAYDALKADGDDENVIGGSFTLYQNSWGGTGVTKAYMDAGYLNYCDYAGCHPYGTSVSEQINFVNDSKKLYAGKPVIITEWGFKPGPSDSTLKSRLDEARTLLREKVSIVCFYRLTATSSYPGIVTYSSPSYIARAPFYEMYKSWPKKSGIGWTYQLESQTVTASGASTSTVTDGSARYVQMNATAPGPSMQFTAGDVPPGHYDLYVRYKKGSDRGILSTTVDGAAVGDAIDQYGNSYAAAYAQAKVGEVLVPATRDITFRFTVDGKNASSSGYKINVDYVNLQRSVESFEIENLSYSTSPGDTVSLSTDTTDTVSGSRLLVFNANAVGDYIEAPLTGLVPGSYSLKVTYKKYNIRGKFRTTVNGTALGGVIDQYNASSIFSMSTLGVLSVPSSGSVTLRFTVDGKNSSSSDFDLVFDRVELVPIELPAVSVTADAGSPAELGPATGTFTVARTAPLDQDLTIFYRLDGTASNGADYASLPLSITIPAGEASASIMVTPIADAVIEGDETVLLTLSSSPSYLVGSPVSATLTIKDKPFDEWRKTHFTSAELTDDSIAGDTADPDADGVANLAEYALSLDPKRPDAAGAAAYAILSDHLTLSYTRLKNAPDLFFAVEKTNDLATPWQSGPSVVEEVPPRIDHGTTETVTVRAIEPVSAAQRQFLRLRIQRQ